jgi:hypothetical protein
MKPTRRLLPLAALCLFAAVPAASAQEQGSLSLGLVKPEDIDSTLWVTANYRFKLGRRVVLEPEAGIWKQTFEADPLGASLRDLNFGANLLYVSPRRDTQLWGGAGLGAHLIKGFGGLGSESESDTRLGLHLLGGLDHRLADEWDVYGALRYDVVTLEGDQSLHQFKLYAGVRYRF